MAGILQSNITLDEIQKLLYVKRYSFYGCYGGWRSELLVETPRGAVEEKFLLCNDCRGVLRDACLYEMNGIQELRCSACIPRDAALIVAQLNREIINARQVYCPLKYKGCNWTNELSELLHHLEECELFPVACPLGCRDERGEVSRVERRGVETHRTCCPMRIVKCEYCKINVKACGMNGHLEVCEEFPIPCPNGCDHKIGLKRKNESAHLNKHCPFQSTECPYSQYGCMVKVQRRSLDTHERDAIHTHLKFTMQSMQSKVTHLEKENEALRTLVPRGNLEWKISGVMNRISQKNISFSEPFFVGQYRLQACVRWVCKDTCVGYYIYIMKGEWDDTLKWPFRFKDSVVLVNQLNPEDNYKRVCEITEVDIKKFPQCFQQPLAVKNEGFGDSNFISHAEILQPKYLKNDSIKLNISVEQMLVH